MRLSRKPETRAAIDFAALREASATALHYQFDTIPVRAFEAARSGSAEVKGVTLEEDWKQHIDAATFAQGIERERVRDLGLKLLQEANDATATA